MNKENIFEELNKMRNLIHAKAGTVISEQSLDVSGDVGRLMRQLNAGNTNETDVVNTIKKYKTKQDFQNLVSQYEKIVGKKFGGHLRNALDPTLDTTEWNDLKNHLSTIGITLNQMYNSNDDSTTFGGLNTPAAEVANTDEAWKTTYSCVTTQPGAKAVKTNNAGTAYLVGQIYYYANGRKMLADGSMASYSCATEFKSGTANSGGGSGSGSRTGGGSRQDVNSRFSKSAESLGIQAGKMDLQTLQSILKTLEGGQSTPAVAATATQGTPDLAQLTAALNQLNA